MMQDVEKVWCRIPQPERTAVFSPDQDHQLGVEIAKDPL